LIPIYNIFAIPPLFIVPLHSFPLCSPLVPTIFPQLVWMPCSNWVVCLTQIGHFCVTVAISFACKMQIFVLWSILRIMTCLNYVYVNRIQGKSVHARAFAFERQQSPVSYVGINIVSRTILKIMYCTISNSTLDDESR